MIPGGALHRLAVCLCSATTLERVVEPAIADLQSELAAAEFSPPLQRARILVVGYLAILVAMLMCACELAAADERRPLIRTFGVAGRESFLEPECCKLVWWLRP